MTPSENSTSSWRAALRKAQESRLAIGAAFLVLALAGALAISTIAQRDADRLYMSQVESCERGNVLRAENNRRLESHNAEKEVLKSFLAAARQARINAGTPEDLATAREYSRLVDVLNSQVTYGVIDTVNCKQTVKKP